MTAHERAVHFWNTMQNAGFKSLRAFREAAGVSEVMARKMSREGEAPKDDVVTYRVAGLLNVAPTDLWPDWQPCTNDFARAIYAAGYTTISEFARACNVAQNVVDKWVNRGVVPRSDDTVERVAKLLHVEPTVLWPTWAPRPIPHSRQMDVQRQMLKFGVDKAGMQRMTMEELRASAGVYVGQRLLIVYPQKEWTPSLLATVVECGRSWFRVQYDIGWCECFHYQCRIDRSEGKHFRGVTKMTEGGNRRGMGINT